MRAFATFKDSHVGEDGVHHSDGQLMRWQDIDRVYYSSGRSTAFTLFGLVGGSRERLRWRTGMLSPSRHDHRRFVIAVCDHLTEHRLGLRIRTGEGPAANRFALFATVLTAAMCIGAGIALLDEGGGALIAVGVLPLLIAVALWFLRDHSVHPIELAARLRDQN